MRYWLLFGIVSLIVVACSTPAKPLEEALPANVDSWTRSQVSAIDPASAPELVRSLGLKQAATATYTGPATVKLRIYEMNVATSAFELIQKWRRQDGLAVHSGPFFLVADPDSAPQAAALLEALRKQLH